MKWFKHSALASKEMPVRGIKEKYGFYGVGIFWSIIEMVHLYDGKLTLKDLKQLYCNSRFSQAKIEEIIRESECLQLDNKMHVLFVKKHTAFTQLLPSNACAIEREEEIRKEKEVVKKNDNDNGGNENENQNQNENENDNENQNHNDETKNRLIIDSEGSGCSARLVQGQRRKPEVEDAKHKGVNEDGLRMRTKRDWCFNMQAYNGEYREVVCMKSRFSMLLNKRWADAINYFACHLMMIGEIDMFCTETEFKRHFSIFVTNEVTGKALHEAMDALEKEERIKSSDFMSTYFGPPLPDDAPPRPSHTAVFDFNFKRWEEPRAPS